MSLADEIKAPLRNTDRFFIGGEWVQPSSGAMINVIDSGTEEVYFSVAEAQAADISRAVEAARHAFDDGPWPRMTHAQRAEYMRAIAAGVRARADDLGQIWPRESGALHVFAPYFAGDAANTFEYYAGLADTFAWEEPAQPTAGGEFGLIVHESVGVVGAINPVECPHRPAGNQGRPGAHRRLHGHPQVLAGSAGRGIPGGGGGRGGRATDWRAQRGDRRPRSFRAARPRPTCRQDCLHRLDGSGPAHRLDLR